MTLRFVCKNCGKEISVKFLKPGETARCKNCDSEMPVPADAIDDGVSIIGISEPCPVSPAGLSSEGSCKALVVLLWIDLALTLVHFPLALHLKDSLSPIPHSTAGWVLLVSILLYVPVFITQIIVFLCWIARVHSDLIFSFPDYPITPGKAVARLLVPVYHVWGVWSVFSTMAMRLKDDETRISHHANSLSRWLLPLVATFVFEYISIAEMIYDLFGSAQTLAYEHLFSDWDVAEFGIHAIIVIIYIRVTILVRNMMRQKHST